MTVSSRLPPVEFFRANVTTPVEGETPAGGAFIFVDYLFPRFTGWFPWLGVGNREAQRPFVLKHLYAAIHVAVGRPPFFTEGKVVGINIHT